MAMMYTIFRKKKREEKEKDHGRRMLNGEYFSKILSHRSYTNIERILATYI